MPTEYTKRQKRVGKALDRASDLIASGKVPLARVKKMRLSSATLLTASAKAKRGTIQHKTLIRAAEKRNRQTARRMINTTKKIR